MDKLFPALCLVWALSEFWIGLSRRSGDAARTRDAGTLRLLLVTIYACVALAVWLGSVGQARFPRDLRVPMWWLGIGLMLAGLPLRWWAIHVLSRYFTVDVNIQPDHQLIRSGPYRWLRHPSYTGALLTFYGFSLGFGNWLSLLVVVVPVTLAFLWRIRIEERVLAAAFPGHYPAYAAATRRLIPFVW
ncbi:MAG: methyltransferase family protein [Luteimonas sp.]